MQAATATSLLSKDNHLLVLNPRLASVIGLNEAIVLQQLAYWLEETTAGVEHEGQRWVYNTHEQWAGQFPFWSVDTVKRTFAALCKRGLVRVKRMACTSRSQTNHYVIDYAAVALLGQGNLPSCASAICPVGPGQSALLEQCNLPLSLTKTSSNTTTKIITAVNEPAQPVQIAPGNLPTLMMMMDGVKPEILKDFLAVRLSKKAAPLTQTAVDSLRLEATQAGLTLEQALVVCCQRGWARFVAAWLLDGRSTPATMTTPSPAAPAQPVTPPAPAPAPQPAAPEVAAAGRQRLMLIRQSPPLPVTPAAPLAGIQIGATGPGWAHRIVNRHRAGERVSHASLREACTALRITPASLASAQIH